MAISTRKRAAKNAASLGKRLATKSLSTRLLLKGEVLARVRVSYPTLWSWMVAGEFPRSVKIGGKSAWYESEVEDWLANLTRSRLKGDEP
jgi:prophage regulatory protein